MLIVLATSTIAGMAQDSTKKDTVKDDEGYWDGGKGKFGWHFIHKKSKFFSEYPFIEVNYGMDVPNMNKDKYKGTFTKTNSFDIKLGHSELRNSGLDSNILKFENHYVFFSKMAPGLGSERQKDLETAVDAIGFGIGGNDGYGYKFSNTSNILFYYGSGLSWTKLNFKYPDSTKVVSNELQSRFYTGRFGDSYRFGEYYDGGVKINLFRHLSLNASYQRYDVFERHMFWYWVGSKCIEEIGQHLVDEFAEKIGKSSPYAMPVVSFVLKNALAYGLYELRTKNMNWPISTAAPFTFDSFKFGVTLNF